MPARLTLRIDRAPVLTLWAAVVAQRLGMPHDAALTVGEALAGITAHSKGERVKPEAVERYLGRKFGDALGPTRTEMGPLTARRSPERLNQEGFHLDEPFRPAVPPDERGWGARRVLDIAKIEALGSR